MDYRAKHDASDKAWRDSPAGKLSRANIRYRFVGILNTDNSQFTTSNVIDAFFLQKGNCKFCYKPLYQDIHVDHDHITLKFRGLLHSLCNKNKVGNHTLESALRLVEYFKEIC